MKIMQHAYAVGSTTGVFEQKGKTYHGVIPAMAAVTVLFFDEHYVAVVRGHVEPRRVQFIDAKMLPRDKVYETTKECEPAVQAAKAEFLSYEDGRQYWAKNQDVI